MNSCKSCWSVLPRILKNLNFCLFSKFSKKCFSFQKVFCIFFQLSVKISGKQKKYFKTFFSFKEFEKTPRVKNHKLKKKRSFDIRIFLETFFVFMHFKAFFMKDKKVSKKIPSFLSKFVTFYPILG